MRKTTAVCALLCCLAFGVACSRNFGERNRAAATTGGTAEDFAREYDAKENMTISIKNASGDIIVRGTDTNRIVVRGIKEGSDRDQIEVEDRSNDDMVDLGVKYNCRRCRASLRFEVEVPRGMRLRFDEISAASGNVQISDVTGTLEAKTASGNVRIENVTGKVEARAASGNVSVRDASGEVSAETASGNVDVSIKRLSGDGDMEFSTASGNVEVALPTDVSADVRLSTISGNVKTDFPLEVRRPHYGPGESAEGTLGSGGRDVRLSAVSGSVKLMKS